MRRGLTVAVIVLAAAFAAAPAAMGYDQQGDPDGYTGGEQRCREDAEHNFRPFLNVDYAFGGGPTGGAGHISAQNCDEIPPDGNVTLAGNFGSGRPNCGYIVYDGDPTNTTTGAGYVALDNQGPEVGQGDSEYNDGGCVTP